MVRTLSVLLAAAAVDSAARGTWSGHAQIGALYSTSNRRLDDRAHVANILGAVQGEYAADRGKLAAELQWFPEGGVRPDHRSLRQLLAEAYFEHFDLRLGKQIIRWGRADGVKPTDNLTSQDFTWLGLEDERAHDGAYAAKVQAYAGAWSIAAIWLPFRAPDRTPVLPALPAPAEEGFPAMEPAQGAAKTEYQGQDWLASLSYYQGRDPHPHFHPALSAPAYPLMRTVGADFEWIAGKFKFKGESALNHFDGSGTKSDFLQSVVGVEHPLFESLTLVVEFVHEYLASPPDPAGPVGPLNNQFRKQQFHPAAMLLFTNADHTAKASSLLLLNQGPRDLAWMARYRHNLTDRLSLETGLDYYWGRGRSYFGMFEKNRVAMAGFKYRTGF